MGKSNPSPPPAPDPTALANAQADASIRAAQATAWLNRVNQTGPMGASFWTPPADPSGQWSQTTTLSPQEQALLSGAQGVAGSAIGQLGMPNLRYGIDQATLQTSLPNAGGIQKSLDLSGVQPIPTADNAAYNRAVDSTYGQFTSRLDPQWNQQRTQLETQLANQGVVPNSDAWNRAIDEYSRNKNDAYNTALNQSVLTGNTLEQGQFGMGLAANQAGVGNALTAGNFANAAQGQQFGQNLSGAQFANTANNQGFQNSLANAELNNATSGQAVNTLEGMFNLPNSIGNPNFAPIPSANVQAPDVIGAQSLATQAQLAAYQSQVASDSAKKGGTGGLIGTLGAAAGMASPTSFFGRMLA